jgi:hypothetical protein
VINHPTATRTVSPHGRVTRPAATMAAEVPYPRGQRATIVVVLAALLLGTVAALIVDGIAIVSAVSG